MIGQSSDNHVNLKSNQGLSSQLSSKMTTIIFVHGIGGRLENCDESFKSIQEKVISESKSRNLTIPSVVPCIWGDIKGANPQGLSRPDVEQKEESQMDEKDLLWQKLYEDPLWEIRRLGYREKKSQDPGSLFGKSNKDKLQEKVKIIETKMDEEGFKNQLIRFGLQDIIRQSYQQVIDSQTYQGLLSTVGASQEAECTAIARGIVAVSIQLLKNQGKSSAIIYNAKLRDEAIDYLNAQIMPDKEMGLVPQEIKQTLKQIWQEKLTQGVKKIGSLGLPMLTDYLQNSPQTLTGKIDVLAGDILIYQTSQGGQGIRREIQKTIEACQDEETIILLAHSLGGVACVDLLVEQEIKNVKVLITVGSQAPFFYEIDALQSLQPKQEKSFPKGRFKWLNIYDPKDFLSFVGSKVFPDSIKDKSVNNQQPFPLSHLAYWENAETWQVIFDYLEENQLI